MGWIEFRVEVAQGEAEDWADAYLAAGALSVQAEDADADSLDEQALFGEPGSPAPGFGWRRTRLAVLVAPDVEPAALGRQAAATMRLAPPAVVDTRPIADQDWVAATQAQFEPIPIGRRLLISPSWHAPTADLDATTRLRLIVDPGLAFGTGSHPTTRLCLEWLDAADLRGRSVLDYGCGSGILAIAAARLGAAPVEALDIDPVAVTATGYNAARNDVALSIGSSRDVRPTPADVVVANILSSPLKLLAPALSALVRPGGSLVLSGVLERQVDEVAAAYAALLPVRAWRVRDGWACLVGSRPADVQPDAATVP